MAKSLSQPLAIFPLPGAILFPGSHLPLHVFEPRYRALVNDAIANDGQIGIIQPRGSGEIPELYQLGCAGRIIDLTAFDDGRYNIVLEGFALFQKVREMEVSTPFRQLEVKFLEHDEHELALSSVERALIEREAYKFSMLRGYSVNWDDVTNLDDRALINGIAQIAPFDSASKQALLETKTLSERAEMLVQLFQFYGKRADGDNIATLQ